MKSKLTPEQRVWRDNRDRKILNIISASAFLGLGVWMLLDPSKKKHASVEKATVALVKMLWGFETGCVITVLALVWITVGFIKLNKYKKQFPKPQ